MSQYPRIRPTPFDEGARAYDKGRLQTANRYPAESWQNAEWNNGWMHAEACKRTRLACGDSAPAAPGPAAVAVSELRRILARIFKTE